ncbi:MAG TPA: methionine biosynthesis protein MetW [Candidatus Acidoferrales bacterium]|nr:methionine biosynthesis protein MetW [Candidatus Acidoferrales bacterium]
MNYGVYETVEQWIPPKSRVLDLGTGDGAFLERLAQTRQVIGEGVEKDAALVTRCVQRGLVVHQGDIADGLDQHADGAFDFVLLLGTFQELVQPAEILREAFRVGRQIIISYSNFAHYRVRLQVLFSGRTPVTRSLPAPWYRTRNLHFLSVADFETFCLETGINQSRRAFFSGRGLVHFLPNLRAETAVSLLAH